MRPIGNPLPTPKDENPLLVPTIIAKHIQPKPSEIYPVLWRFAASRQEIYQKRIAGEAPPWTTDAIFEAFKFTNAYRAADRVSQYLIKLVCAQSLEPATLFLRTILFKIFNNIATWEAITSALGSPEADTFDFTECDRVLSDIKARGKSLYSGAYIMPSGKVTGQPKHEMHLSLIKTMLQDRLPERLQATRSLCEAYRHLRSYPSLGPFLAFQYTVDLNYTTLMDHSEMEFVVAGPGALDGLSKCFQSLGEYTPEDTIRWLTENQEREFDRLGLHFSGLWGRPLQLIDVQNLFCEVSKYTRASHPDIKGRAGRQRIKRRFTPSGPLPLPFFPPKWGLNSKIGVIAHSNAHLATTAVPVQLKLGA